MMKILSVLAALSMIAAGTSAQMPAEKPGAPIPARVKAGHYRVDPDHTQIVFTVDHLGFNSYWGIFGNATGTLDVDATRPAAAKDATGTTTAKIAGLLTLHGVTRPIVLDATFTGAGLMPMLNVDTIGFSATATVQRSAFGVSSATAFVSDVVPLQITAAFMREK
jgi:polyisoprenoid-binding protein YceI